MITWEDLIDSIRLEEVLDDLGIAVTEVIKSEHWSSCPLPTHPGSDSSPSFSVNDETLLWNCFICGGGSLPKLVIAMNDLEGEDAWLEALEYLLPFSDGDPGTDDGYLKQITRYLERSEGRPKRTRGVTLPYFNPIVLERLERPPMSLLEKWHIFDEETVEVFGLRYDPERRRLKNGKEYVGPALIIPHYFGTELDDQELVGYQERWLDIDRPKWLPKYTNSDDFPKKDTLFNYARALFNARLESPIILVESVMTVIRLYELGYTAVSSFGASVNPRQVRYLRAFGHSGVWLTTDNDPDFQNRRGQWVKGAGYQHLEENKASLVDYVPVEVIPPVGQDKGDMADLDDAETLALIKRRKPVFAGLPTR